MNTALVLEYEKVFAEQPKPIQFYLQGISRSTLLSIGAHFLGFEQGVVRGKSYKELLIEILGPTNKEFCQDIVARVETATRNLPGVVPIIITPESSLTFFEYAYEHGESEDSKAMDIRKSSMPNNFVYSTLCCYRLKIKLLMP